MNKKVVGLSITHTVKLNRPIETDIEDICKELGEITDEIFVSVDNLMDELGHTHRYAFGAFIYEGEELEGFKR